MALNRVPTRDVLVLTDGPLAANLTSDTTFPASTTATLHLYDVDWTQVAFWPVTVNGPVIEMLIEEADIAPVIDTAKRFRVYVVYPTHARRWPWYEGNVVRSI